MGKKTDADPKKFRKGPGRPTEITDELIEKICNALKLGAYVETAAALSGIEKKTFYNWVKRGAREPGTIFEKFLHAVEEAQAQAEARDLLVIDRAANGQKAEYERDPSTGRLVLDDEGKPVVLQRGIPPNWSAAAWRLERRFPRRWGRLDRLETSGPEGGPQVIVGLPANGRESQPETNQDDDADGSDQD